MKKAHLMSDFIKKISPRLGLEPTKMRQDLRKSVSILLEREENVLSFGCYFSSDKVSQYQKNFFLGFSAIIM